MSKMHNAGIIGCGDFLRTEMDRIGGSSRINVKSVFDTDDKRAARAAEGFSAVAATPREMFEDDGIDTVFIFVPPWVRKDLVIEAAGAGKHIITTKPLAPNLADAMAIVEAVEESGVQCGVLYMRTANPLIEAYKDLFDGGEIGALSLYKQDWIHHYPQWNSWATDPAKNGGPFMDAMIHNLNAARYLMGRPVIKSWFESENCSHDLPCRDTEFMKLDFEGRGSAYLFITWSADLAVQSTDGNYREHIDHCYMVTDQGWYVTHGSGNGELQISATRDGVIKTWPVPGKLIANPYDSFVAAIDNTSALPREWPTLREAYDDISLLLKDR